MQNRKGAVLEYVVNQLSKSDNNFNNELYRYFIQELKSMPDKTKQNDKKDNNSQKTKDDAKSTDNNDKNYNKSNSNNKTKIKDKEKNKLASEVNKIETIVNSNIKKNKLLNKEKTTSAGLEKKEYKAKRKALNQKIKHTNEEAKLARKEGTASFTRGVSDTVGSISKTTGEIVKTGCDILSCGVRFVSSTTKTLSQAIGLGLKKLQSKIKEAMQSEGGGRQRAM